MPKYAHPDVLDGGLSHIKANAAKMLLISAYAVADSYATVIGNKLAEVAMAPEDFAITSTGNNRVLTTAAGKTAAATATAGGSPDLHIAFTNGVDKVLWVTDETSNQPITAGNVVNFPSLTYTSNQPT